MPSLGLERKLEKWAVIWLIISTVELAFSTLLTLSVTLFASWLTLTLVLDLGWAQQYRWLLPVFGYGAIFLLISTLPFTRWFRKLLSRISPDNNKTGSPVLQQPTPTINRGLTNFGTSFTNFGPGTINVGSPEHRHQSEIEEENWPGFLEAVIPSSLTVQRSEHIFAKVSKRSSDGSPGEYGSGSGWARTSCAVPFRTFDGSQRPTQIRLELVMTNPNILCSRRFFDLDLNWNDPQRQVSFEVYAKQEGIYSADIFLLARRKHIATVTVSSEARSDATSAKDEIYQVLAKVTITLEISLEHRTGIDKSSGKEPNIDQGLGMGM